MDRFVSPLLLLLASASAGAAETVAKPEWARHFSAQGVQGTFVLFDPARNTYFVLDETRAREGFRPASTFKVPNALIGLEVGSIKDEREVFRWDGKPKPLKAWERDHTLDTGMRESVVWMFQEIARRTGKQRMKEWIDRLEYGNRDISGGIDQFWLRGSLRISAFEQVEFLRKLAEGKLPATQRAQRLVRNAMLFEKTPDYEIHAKTGTSTPGKEGVCWWIGWVEKAARPTAYFAMNYTCDAKMPYDMRFAIGRAILREADVAISESPPA